MMNRLARLGLALALTTALAGRAAAQEDESADDDSDPCADVEDPCGGSSDQAAAGNEGAAGGEEAEPAGTDGNAAAEVDASIETRAAMAPTLPSGSLAIMATVQAGLSADAVGGEVGNPLSIAPDVWYGVNERLSIGGVTSIQAVTGFWSGALGGLTGTGACLSDEPGTDPAVLAGCTNTFDNAGLEGLFALKADDSTGIALDVGFHAVSFDAGFYDAKVGARGALRTGKLGVGLTPSVLVAITERGDVDGDSGGNFDQIQLPIDLGFYITPTFQIGVQSGIRGSLQHFGDDYTVPVAFGAMLMLNEHILAAASFSLDRVAGATPEGVDGPGAADLRSASLLLGYML